ncbi:MAG: S-adenosylmethionine:tRNA ribosyltransferase-isomerase, partial [Clostridiales bacterium]|nr:S-adenosylmethionine:tRNA ribosyltransferase-isomerase [Clostridiales bacterium]
MKKSDFFYELPPELIAQHPAEPRSSSRLLSMDRQTGEITHGTFTDIVDMLRPGDCLVLNDTRVIPARIYGTKEGSGAVVEFLLLSQKRQDVWEVLAGSGKKAKPGARFSFAAGKLEAQVLEILEGGNRLAAFTYDKSKYSSLFALLDEIGQMPLPHYITEELEDKERYQT